MFDLFMYFKAYIIICFIYEYYSWYDNFHDTMDPINNFRNLYTPEMMAGFYNSNGGGEDFT